MSLSEIIIRARNEREEIKAQGFAGPELDAAFEKIVREVWPFTREWFFVCNNCDDYGFEWNECPGDSTCGASTWQPSAHQPCPHKPRRAHAPHSYVRFCFCEKGRSLQRTATSPDADFSNATKTAKKTPTRWGRT